MKSICPWAALALLLATAGRAAAQDEPRVGVTMGYPAAAGVLWRVTEGIAVRPEFAFSVSDNDSDATEGTTTRTAYAISGLFYLTKADNVRTYVSPRFAYSRSSAEVDLTIPQPLVSLGLPSLTTGVPFGLPTRVVTAESKVRQREFSGSFGAEYAMRSRFAVFGELGIGYTSLRTSTELPRAIVFDESVGRSHTWSTRTAVGVVLFF